MGARQEGLVLVTKDEDFLDLSVTRGCPPKVVCLAIGNASNAATLVPEQIFCVGPAVIFFTHQIFKRRFDIFQPNFIHLGTAIQSSNWPNGDARLLHIN